MSVWNIFSSIVLTVVLSGIAATALGCAWPTDPPRSLQRLHHRPHPSRRPIGALPAPIAWTCGLPGVPLNLDEAHGAMRRHRNHDCPRKRAAYATLVAYGCLLPDSARRHYRQKARS